ncbi:MAG TPA: autotransporter-associated beta strand repeat-containing protein, partial [Lacunisphaera sp.]|nr:autotransporter-associated beta strand repeat-containing protein [Lacunisphaera sp.]
GITTINSGTLSVATIGNGGVAGNLGKASNAANRIVLGGGTLQYTGSTASTNRAFTLTNGTTSTINVSSGSTTLTMSGAAAASSGNLVKSGSGTLAFSGAHGYTGTTTVSQGTLQLNANAPSGSAGTLGNASSTVTLNDGNTGSNDTGLVIGASGVTVARNISVANLGSGTTTLGGNITSGTGSFTGNIALNRATTFDADGTSNITFSAGAISGSGPITKTGTGTVTLSGTNTYTGATTISAGTLSVGTIGNGGVAGNLGQASNAAGNLVLSGGTLQYTGSTASTNRNFTLANGTTSTVDVTTAATNLTISGGSTATTGALTKAGLGTLTLSGSSGYSGTTTVSAGTLVANGSSSLGAATGGVTVNSGATLALAGGAAVTQASPTNSVTISKSGTLSLNGTGASGATGALQAVGSTGQTSQWLGNITLSGNTTISAADNLLILGNATLANYYNNTIGLGGNTLTFNTTSATGVAPQYLSYPAYGMDSTNILVNSTISGTGGITKTGAGTVNLLNGGTANSFSGATLITGGKLIVDGPGDAPVISSASVTVGNSSSPGSADTVVLQMGQLASSPSVNNVIGSSNTASGTASASMTVYEDGFFNMNGGSNALVNLTLQGGHVGDSYLSSNPPTSYSSVLGITGGITTNASSQTAVINNWKLGLSSNAFTANIADGAAANDLRIDSIVVNDVGFTNSNTSTSLAKTGSGTLLLTGTNTYQGVTAIQNGTVKITNSSALGQSGSYTGDLNNGTTVAAGAQLQLDGSGGALTVANETLTLNGNGTSTTGDLRNVAGNNQYNGFIGLGGNSRINADSGSTLTIGATAGSSATLVNGTAAGRTLTVGGAGDTTINAVIGSNIGTLTKDGSGTLTLAGQSAAQTVTNVNDGSLALNLTNGLTAAGASVNVGDGTGAANSATLLLQQSNQIADTAAVTVNADGRLNLNSKNDTVGSIAGSGNIIFGTGQLTAGANNSNTTFSGHLTGTTGSLLAKTGSGTLTISSNVNASPGDFAGNLQLDAGTLALASATNTFANSTLTISAGATLKLTDATLNIANLALTGTGTITLDFSGTASILNVTNTLTIASGITVNVINWQNAADYFYAANWTGAVVDFRGAAPMNQVVFDSPTWVGNDTKWQSYDRQITPVPEPGTYGAMLLAASSLLLGYRRWRRSRTPVA